MTTIERLKQVRKTLGLSQQSFADKLGVSQSTLAMVEAEKRALSSKNIKLICSTFSVNETWLRTGEGTMFNDSPLKKEFMEIFVKLSPATQQYLLDMARGLLTLQNKENEP